MLLDGTYTGVCSMVIRTNLAITAVNYGNAVIDCQQHGGQAFIVAPALRVSFNGITIQNALSEYGSAICSPGQSKISIDSCYFINNTASSLSGSSFGGAILTYDEINITNSIFVNNTVTSPTPTGVAYAGAVYIALETSLFMEANIINCSFIANSVIGGVGDVPYSASECGYGIGGALLFAITADGANVNIQGSSFINNFVKGGDCYHGIITGQASAGALDLAIAASYLTAVIDSTIFSGNSVTAGSQGNIGAYAYGGAAAFGVGGYDSLVGNNLTVTNTIFDSNTVNGANSYLSLLSFGGGLVLTDCIDLVIANSSFLNNVVNGGFGTVASGPAEGGALVLQNTAKDFQILITDTIFSDNKAVAGSSDSGSPADATGGAIFIAGQLSQSNIELANVEFTRNFAIGGSTATKSVGGSAYSAALALFGSGFGAYLTLETCKFDRNSAIGGNGVLGGPGQGGAGVIQSMTQVTISNSSFTDNLALGGSGSLVVNTAYGGQAYGGALCFADAPALIINSNFSGNTAKGGKGAATQTVWDLQGQDGGSGGNAYGGSIYSTQGNTVNIIATEFSENCATGGEGGTPTGKGFPVGSPGSSGKAFGGAVGADSLIITDSQFQNNLAGDPNANTVQSAGGAIGAGNYLEISTTSFSNNIAVASSQAFGGAILSASLTSIQNVSFEFNSVSLDSKTGYGGALYVPPPTGNSSSVELVDIRMNNNTAAGLGGAVFINNTETVIIQKGDILSNAAQYGGGIYVFSEDSISPANQSLLIQSMNFTDNTAAFGGGALFISYDTLSQVNASAFLYQYNEALYGSSTASDVTKLAFATSPPTAVWPGEVFALGLVLLDGLNNTVINPNLTVTVTSDSSSFISGVSQDTSLIDMTSGYFMFPTSTVVANTGSYCKLNFTSVSPSSLDTMTKFYANITLLVTECPPSTYLAASSFGYTCNACEQDEYNLDGEKCRKCPKPTSAGTTETSACVDLDIGSRQLIVKEGFYPHPSFENPSKLLACRYAKACQKFACSVNAYGTELEIDCQRQPRKTAKSTSDSTCADGYEDRMCSRCKCDSDECYYQTSENSCLQCEASHRDQWIENQFYLMNGLFAMGVIYMLVTRAIPSALIRGLWFYVQSSLTLLVPDAWPNWIYKLQGYLPFIGTLQIYSATCLLPSSWSNPIPQFLIAMITPFLLTAAALIGFLALKFFRWLDKKFGLREKILQKVTCVTCLLPQKPPASSSSKHRKGLGYLVLRSFLLVLNLTYFSLSASILMVLQPCDDDDYMPQYPWISCSSSEYHTFILLATAFALFYLLGVPLLFGGLLFWYRNEIRALKATKDALNTRTTNAGSEDYDFEKNPSFFLTQPLLDASGTDSLKFQSNNAKFQTLKLIEFLFQSYTADAFWFEIIWITRKLAIAMAINLIPSPLGQVTAITLVLAVGLGVQTWLQPYEKAYKYINTIEIVSSGVIAFTLNIGYHIKEYGSGITKEAVQSVIVIMNSLLMIGIVAVMIFQLVQFRKGKRQRTLANASFRWMMTETE
eukprot:CAMPEP_0168566746 /NCGR_PEP_ID=MMETSP0413-20121227/14595_1 /TAXON_ID=136452 /ORGANISM="Filamoeba nolandi, Strain NC-AS-23-1" /LENGTH=1522 /DNA_ID=CAMNT_0008598809 /DNA_START=230 /DNA_END=4798 /DNA_ORIENTATION=+